MIDVKIVADSLNGSNRLTTFELIYPRYIHAQMLTHRVFSRNTSSSRAIPVAKMIQAVKDNPVIPKEWGANQSGMQSYEVIGMEAMREADKVWISALENAIKSAEELSKLGVHKQFVNRLLEPFAHVQVILSGTEFENFFDLRRWKGDKNGASQHEIAEVAEKMFQCLEESKPVERYWHIPYFNEANENSFISFDSLSEQGWELIGNIGQFIYQDFYDFVTANKVPEEVIQIIQSVARCARISYTKQDSCKSILGDIDLVASKLYPEKHCSPFEHVAVNWEPDVFGFGNFKGWMQLRTLLFIN